MIITGVHKVSGFNNLLHFREIADIIIGINKHGMLIFVFFLVMLPGKCLSSLVWYRVIPESSIVQSDSNINELIQRIATRNQLDPCLLHAIISTESGYNQEAVSGKGAVGLMQVMPDTGARFGISNLRTPENNIEAGARYLRFLMTRFSGRLDWILAGYNAGEGAVIRYHGVPPFEETLAYVERVKSRYNGNCFPPGKRLRIESSPSLPDQNRSNVNQLFTLLLER